MVINTNTWKSGILFLQNKETEPTKCCVLKVDQFETILTKTIISSSGPDKMSHNMNTK